jgi:isochorismate pyruvate lyase
MNITDCETLTEVRENIDKIDCEIIKLFSIRKNYVNQAAKFKKDLGDVEAPDRVNQVIDKVKKIAGENNVDPNLIGKIYEIMINYFIGVEKEKYNSLEE